MVWFIFCFALHLHLSFKYDVMREKYSARAIQLLKYGAALMAFIGLFAATSFFILAGVYKVPIMPVQESLVLPGIQSFLIFQESALYLYSMRKYLKILAAPDMDHLVA